MERDHASVNVVAGTVALVAVGILLAALYYAIVTRADPVRCVFGDAQCSQTAATYLLALLTACAFFATYRAVLYTRSSYENSIEVFKADRTPVMTLQRCDSIDDAALFANPGRLAEKDRRHVHSDVDILHYFLDDAEMPELATDAPADCVTPADDGAKFPYDLHHYDVLSLGRVPFINGYLYLDVKGRADPLRVYVGSVAPNDYVHIVLWIQKELAGRRKIWWSAKATDDSVMQLKYCPPPEAAIGKTIDFDMPNIESEPRP